MEVYVITKMCDYGDGMNVSVVGCSTNLSAARIEMDSEVDSFLEDNDLTEDDVKYRDNDKVEISRAYVDNMDDYVVAEFEIHHSSL